MLFDVVGLGLGVSAAFKSGYQFLNSADGCASGFRGFAGRLMGNGGGCFRATTGVHGIGLEFDNGSAAWIPAGEDESHTEWDKSFAMAPNDESRAATMIWVALGIGLTFSENRKRRRRKRTEQQRRDEQAIDTLFTAAPREDLLWT